MRKMQAVHEAVCYCSSTSAVCIKMHKVERICCAQCLIGFATMKQSDGCKRL